MTTSVLISPEELHSRIQSQQLIILDASMEQTIGAPLEAIESCYLPSARTFDIEKVFSVADAPFPHTLPSANACASALRQLGITPDSSIVIYDRNGLYSSPRAWFILKYMGVNNVQVLNGGLQAWIAAGFECVERPERSYEPTEAEFVAEAHWLVTSEEILANSGQEDFVVVDARSEARFFGQAPEPRPGVRGGHMPHALNLPFARLLDGGQYHEREVLQHRFAQLAVEPNQTLVFSCGSGITACIVLLAAYECGFELLKLYDGSWAEWGAKEELPVVLE